MLEQMGVSNAAAIVEQALAKNEEVRKYATEAVAAATSDMSGKTKDASEKLLEQANMSETARKALFELVAQQTIFANQDLGFREKITGLEQLANAYMGVAKAATFQDKFEDNLRVNAGRTRRGGKELSVEEIYQKTMDQVGGSVFPNVQEQQIEINYTGGTATKDTLEKLAKEKEKEDKKKEETAEQFDWIIPLLDNINEAVDKTKDKISDLLSFGSKKKQTQKAIEATTKAIEAEYKAMKKYAEAAKTLSADAAKETTETVTESISGAVSDAVNGAVTNIVSTTAGVVNDAMQYVDKLPYVWGGASLKDGADCSGFVMQLYKKYGINLPHNAQSQFNSGLGTKVYNQQELQPGDLVFFGSGANNIHHVGIYAGDGQFIEEKGSRWGTKLSPLAGRDYYAGLRFGSISTAPSSSVSSSSDDLSATRTYTKTVPGVPQKTLEHYQKLVREGSFDVETITNEKLKNAIKSYQEWWEKVKACRDKIDELNSTLKELYKTMAQIPIERRDKNVETLETRLGILDAKKENVDDVTVNPKEYKATRRTVIYSRKKINKQLKTKAQKTASGLSKTQISELKKCIKSGKTVPAKILNAVTSSSLYQQCKEYNDAVYEHSLYAKSDWSISDSIKRTNKYIDQEIDAENAKTKQFRTAYDSASKDYAKSLKNVSSQGAKAASAASAKGSGASKATADKIKQCVRKKQEIPEEIMNQIPEGSSLYNACLEYNRAVWFMEAEKEVLDTANFDYQKQRQEARTNNREKKIEKHQNIADKASAKIERNETLAENAETPKKKNKYLKQNNDLLKTQYKHLIAIAEAENDSIEAEKLRAELAKELAGNTERMYQNIENYYSDKRDKISQRTGYLDALNSNALSVEDKNQNLRDQTRQAVKDAQTYEQAYKETADSFNKGRTSTMKTVKKADKLSQSVKDKVISLIKAKKEIPDELLDKVGKYDENAYNELLQYNESLDWLNKAWWNMKTSEQERIYAERENKVQQHQNIADRAQDKIDKNDALSEISTTASEQNKYEKENIRYLNTQYKHLLEIAKLHEDDVEYARLEAEQQSKIAEAYKKMFDNVQTEYENKISLISNNISDLDNEIKKVQASGMLVDASYYNHKITMENQTLEKLKEEESSLTEQLGNIKMFTPAWYECQDAAQNVQNAQADSLAQIKEYKDAINEIADTIQNDIVDAFHDITDEAELLITLLGDNLSDSDTGVLTEDGLAVLSLYVSQMNICKEAAESFHKEIKSMQDALDSGNLSFIDTNGIQREYASVYELKKAIKDFYSSYQDEIKYAYDYESKIVDMMVKKYQSELDYLKELITQKQKLLDSERDLHQYAKDIQKQTDNINSLRKQIAALQGDTSKETESRIQKLQSQLKEAESSLEDQEYERFISDSKDMLDNLYSEYEKLVNDVMKDHDRLLKEGLDLFAQTASDVQDVIKNTAEEHGYEITAEMEKIISSIEGMGSLDSYLGAGGIVTQSLGDIVTEIHNAYTSLSSDFQKLEDAVQSVGFQGKYDTSDKDKEDYNTSGSSDSNVTNNTDVIINTGAADEIADNKGITEANKVIGSSDSLSSEIGNMVNSALAGTAVGTGVKRALVTNLLKNGTNTYDPKTTSSLNKYIYEKYGSALTVGEMSTLSKYLGLNYSASDLATENPNHQKYKKQILEVLKLQGFSRGGIVQDLDDAVRKNNDSVIISANPGESVFNEKQTRMIQEYVNKGSDLNSIKSIVPIMDKIMKMPEVEKKDIPTQNIMQVGDVSFNLPNVHNYADIMRQAQKDPQFEKMIAHIIRHQLGFGSYYGKMFATFKN